MSKNSEIKNLIIELLDDKKVHTTEEIRIEVYKRNIVNPEEKNDAAIRNALYLLKKEKIIVNSGKKGEYRLQNNFVKNVDEKEKYKHAVNLLLKRVEELEKFDWLNCTNDELEEARRDAMLLRRISLKISNMFSAK